MTQTDTEKLIKDFSNIVEHLSQQYEQGGEILVSTKEAKAILSALTTQSKLESGEYVLVPREPEYPSWYHDFLAKGRPYVIENPHPNLYIVKDNPKLSHAVSIERPSSEDTITCHKFDTYGQAKHKLRSLVGRKLYKAMLAAQEGGE